MCARPCRIRTLYRRSTETPPGWVVILCLLSFWGPANAVDPPGEKRDRLTVSSLTRPDDRLEAIHNAYFVPLGETGPAHHQFAGTLTFAPAPMQNDAALSSWQSWFPSVTVRFFSHQGYLIPIERDIVRPPETIPGWGIVFSPGRVWSEAQDQGWSRASFPFVLTGPHYNESHNGVATFLYNDTDISRVRYQIVQEAADWNRFIAWGELEPLLGPLAMHDQERLVAAFETEQNARFPVSSLSALKSSLGEGLLLAFDSGPGNQHLSVSGLVIDGVVYRTECRTHLGDYPYCDEMRHGVFSVTKSMGAMLSLLWLAQKFGGEIFDYKIRDYLDVSAHHNGWDDVTFADSLNMVTGVGDLSHERNATDNDEDYIDRFSHFSENEPSLHRKLTYAFSSGNYPWGPGEVYRYRTMDTFVLAAAMDSLLKSREGPSANLWDRLVEEVLKPIGIDTLPMLHTTERNGARGVPILGTGLYMTIDDVAKITTLLQNGGRHAGRPFVHAAKLTDGLARGLTRGKPTAWAVLGNEFRYYQSLWHLSVDLPDCTVTVPQMIGYGGNIVQLYANGVSAFRFEDGGTWPVRRLARSAHQVRSLCPQ